MKKSDQQRSLVGYILPNMQVVYWLALFISALGMGPRMMNMDGDLGRHITIGRHILSSRSIPTVDLFSHTMLGEPLTPHEWLSQVLFALVDFWFGLDGVVILSALVIATSFSLVFRLAIRRSGSLSMSMLVSLLAAGASSLHWLTRPHIFTFLMVAVWLVLLEQIRGGKKRSWIFLPWVMLFWVNLHGAYIAGFVIWVIYLAGWAWERWIEGSRSAQDPQYLTAMLAGGISSLAATFFNPSGFTIWSTSVGYVQNAYLVGHTAEYLSPDFHHRSTWLFLLLIMVTVGLAGLAGRKRNATDLFLTCAWLAMALYSARNIPLFAVTATPVLSCMAWEVLGSLRDRAKWLGRWVQFDGRLLAVERLMKGWIWPVLVVALITAAYHSGTGFKLSDRANQFDEKIFPVAALDWVGENPQSGEVFNYFPWGGYLLYREWPSRKVFIDGQTDFYGESLTRQYELVLSVAEGWEEVLDTYEVKWILWPVESRLTDVLRSDPRWRLIYEDETAVIFRR